MIRAHWYFITIVYCPQCGSTQETRERRYERRPKNRAKRYEYIEAWNGCGV